MSVKFVPVMWNRRKLIYDAFLLVGVALYVGIFLAVSRATQSAPGANNPQVLAMRAYGSAAFVMLSFILSIGPAARIDRRFLPILYNRRHFGVLFFLVASYHAWQVLGFYHAWGRVSKWESLFRFDASFTGGSVPFQIFGVVALLIYFLLAATSHDFFQKLLGGRLWKRLHMLAYAGYALVVLHVAFGALQYETGALWTTLTAISVAIVGTLHVVASLKSTAPDRVEAGRRLLDGVEWLDAGPAANLRDGHAKFLPTGSGEGLAVVRDGDACSALHGVCAHQGGPLAEGRVIDGCLTCPWHGWQYRPEDGQSPPPFTERLPTHAVMLAADGHLLVDPRPLAPGTPTPPARIEEKNG